MPCTRMGPNAIEIFEVKLDDETKVSYPGDTVSGQVNLKLKRDLRIKEMRLECLGEAYVNWPEYSGSYTRYRYNREHYFSTMAVILGEDNGNRPTVCISEGSYTFPFEFIIPDKYLPTSYEGRHGNIRYWARAIIERHLGKTNIRTKPARFLIGDYVALEDFENVSEALVEQDSLTLGWPCCRSGTLQLRAEVDRGGYRQGDVIHVTVLVTNETSRDVVFTQLSLIQRSLFVDIEGNKTFSDATIVNTRKSGVRSGWEQELSRVALSIPPNTFPTLISCKCIAVLYVVQVRAKLKGKLMKQLYLEVPVVIACALDEPILQDPTLEPISPRPKSRKGTFFCVTGRNSAVKDRNKPAGSEFDSQDENSMCFANDTPQSTTRDLEDEFTADRQSVRSEASNSYKTDEKMKLISRV